MFSVLKQVHSASFVSYCLVRLLFMFDILFMAAVRVDIDSVQCSLFAPGCVDMRCMAKHQLGRLFF